MIKSQNRKFLLLPGDGVGPEVVRETKKILEWFNKNKTLDQNKKFLKGMKMIARILYLI